MSELRPFREIQLQWLSRLVQDQELSPRAVQVAAYIVLEHYNHRLGKAWPSFERISKALGITKKTVQRAISELKDKWFEITHGNGLKHSTEYVPSKQSHAAAQELREIQEGEKRDNIVSLRDREGGQKCPKRKTILASKGGQKCPPNKEKEPKEEKNSSDAGKNAVENELHFVPSSICFARDWSERLEQHQLERLDRLLPEERFEGKRGFWLPALRPATRGSEVWRSQLQTIRRLVALHAGTPSPQMRVAV
nr:helix-turn-helix domain-containing protein [uncultured Celeribacter sp.]